MGDIMALKRDAETILLVDDESDLRDAYAELLKDLGYRVRSEPDGFSALAFVKQGTRIDLVITDYIMPNMNGLKFIKLLRALRPSVPVIMLTAFTTMENYSRARQLGAFEYVEKPVRMEELRRVVEAALEAGRGRLREGACT